MFHELIYTSAPRGLAAGSKGFTTVASTPDMPKQLTSLLESLSGYRHLHHPRDAQAHLNPIAYSFLTTKIAGAQHFILSRVADAGLDYSQRTNKLAHHLAKAGQPEIPGGPAWLSAQAGFFQTNWTGDPRLLPANRPTPGGKLQAAPCKAWQAVMGDAGWAGVLAESLLDPKKAGAYLIVPPGLNLLSLILEAQALLPTNQRWKATFSTFFTKLPPSVDCRWRCVLEGTPEAAAARRAHDRLLLDLTKPPRDTPTGTWADAARNGSMPVAETVTKPRTPNLAPSRPASSPTAATPVKPTPVTPTPAASRVSSPTQPAQQVPAATVSGPPPPMAPQVSSPTGYGLAPPSLIDPYQPEDDGPTVILPGSPGSNQQSRGMLIIMASVVGVLLLTLGGIVLYQQLSPKTEIAEKPNQQNANKNGGGGNTPKATPVKTKEDRLKRALEKEDWDTALSIDPGNEDTIKLALAKNDWNTVLKHDKGNKDAIKLALDNDDWKTVLKYDKGNKAAIKLALANNDWETVLTIDPKNKEAKQQEQAAMKEQRLAMQQQKDLEEQQKIDSFDALKLPQISDLTPFKLGMAPVKVSINGPPWKRSPIKSKAAGMGASENGAQSWKITHDNKMIATLSYQGTDTHLHFKWEKPVTPEQAKQVAAGTIQINSTVYRFELPAATVVTKPDVPTEPTQPNGPQKNATLTLNKDKSHGNIDLKQPKNVLSGSNKPLPLGTVSFTEPADQQFLTIALLGLSDLTLGPPADSSDDKTPPARTWKIESGTDKIATISMQPMGGSGNQYEFTFLWEPTNNGKAVDHLKTGILKFNYAKFTEKDIEAAIVSFFPRHHTDTATKIKLRAYAKGTSQAQVAPWLDFDNVEYTYRLEWNNKKFLPQTGKATDLLKAGVSTPILSVPQSLHIHDPTYKVKAKTAHYWPKEALAYVKANLKIDKPLPRNDKPTSFSLKTEFTFWRQVTQKYELWTKWKVQLERSETGILIRDTINKKEKEIEPVKKKEQGKRSENEKERLSKHSTEMKEITDFNFSRKTFKDQKLRNSVQVHIRFTKRYGQDEITLYQVGSPD